MYVYIYIYIYIYSSLIHWYMVRHRPNCANLSCLCGKSVNYAQTMCKLCVNSSC